VTEQEEREALETLRRALIQVARTAARAAGIRRFELAIRVKPCEANARAQERAQAC